MEEQRTGRVRIGEFIMPFRQARAGVFHHSTSNLQSYLPLTTAPRRRAKGRRQRRAPCMQIVCHSRLPEVGAVSAALIDL